MKSVVLLSFIVLLNFVSISGEPVLPKSIGQNLRTGAVSFTENKGQISDQNNKARPDVLFGGVAGNMVFHLRNDGISYQLSRVDRWKKEDPLLSRGDNDPDKQNKTAEQVTSYRIDIDWLGCNKSAVIETGEALSGYSNYYLEVCKEGVTYVKSYAEIRYKNIYEGIDLLYYEREGQLKYDYIVKPQTDYKQIRLLIKGAEGISLLTDGSVSIKTPLGEIIEGKPVVFQENKEIKAQWKQSGDTLWLELGTYDPNKALRIDPIIRLWGTYYTYEGSNHGADLSVDNLGYIYTVGATASTAGSIIATVGAYQTVFAGGLSDALIVKFDGSGIRQWATYYGGSATDGAQTCTHDGLGFLYVCGSTTSSGSVMATPGAHQASFGGGPSDGFVAKFSSSGLRIWSTIYGGNQEEHIRDCTLDPAGNLYFYGYTTSTNNIASAGAFQPTFALHTPTFAAHPYDVFLVKFTNNGVRLWGTYYGGLNNEWDGKVATDNSGNVYFCCRTENYFAVINLATPGTHQPTPPGAQDVVLVKFSGAGVRLWATYYGTAAFDESPRCTTDPFGNVYLVANTMSTGTAVATPGAHQTIHTGLGNDIFLAKFNSAGVRQWSTLYGGAGGDFVRDVTTDVIGNVYLLGFTNCSLSAVYSTPGSHQTIYGGGWDSHMAKFDANGVRQWATYYGGNDSDQFNQMEVKPGAVYACGSAQSHSGVATPGAHQSTLGGAGDFCLVKFSECSANQATNTSLPANQVICSGQSTTLSVAGTGIITWYTTPASGTAIATGSILVTPTLAPGINHFYVEQTSTCTIDNRLAVTVTVSPGPSLTVSNGSICLGQSFTISPSGASTYSFSGGSAVVNPSVNTSYTVTGTSSLGCAAIPAVVQVTVLSLPTISVNSGIICQGQSFTINPFGANSYTVSGGAFVVNPLTNTNYTVVGSNSAGCLNTNSAVSMLTVLASPNLSVNSGAICSGGTFTIVPSGAITYTVSGGSFNVSPTITSTYSVSGTNTSGCTSSMTALCTVSILPSPSISVNSGAICPGESFTINPSGANNYTISGGNTVVSPTSNSSYTVVGSNALGCESNPVISSVTVHPLPNVTALASSTAICLGESVLLTAAGASSYSWFPSGSSNTLSVSPTNNSTYTLIGLDVNGCSNSSTVLIQIKPNPTVSVNNATICSGTQAILNANVNPSSGITYAWLPGGENSSSINVNPILTTIFSVTVTLNGCTSMTSSTVNVVTAITPNVAFSYNGPYCINQNPVSPNLAPAFANGGQFSSTPEGLSMNPNTGLIDPTNSVPGIYQITYALAASGCSTSASGTAYIEITVPVSLNLSPQVSILTGTAYTLSVNGASSYTWSPPDFLSCTDCQNPIASPPYSMTYCVSSPADVCIAKTCVTILVETGCEGRELSLPNAFSPNGDGSNDEYCLRGWNECIAEFKIIIYNRWGEKVYESEQTEFCWDGSYKGKTQETEVFVYMLKAKLKDGTQISKNGNITLLR